MEISLSRLRHNAAAVRRLVAPRDVVAVVKAQAYGHGIDGVVGALWGEGIRRFAVADLPEARQVRSRLPEAAILVFGGCWQDQEDEFRRLRLSAAVFRDDLIPRGISVHLKIETGMGRFGLGADSTRRLARALGTQVEGFFTTMASADKDREATLTQLERFLDTVDGLPGSRHVANSACLGIPETWLDAVRPGLALYGLSSCPIPLDLKPVLTWKARILCINELPAGKGVGYAGRFVTSRPSRIGILGVGYADGYRRAFSDRTFVRTSAGPAPVVGAVSMDLTAIDVTELPEVRSDEEVTILEAEAASQVSVYRLAEAAETIPYEVLTAIGPRVERTYLG